MHGANRDMWRNTAATRLAHDWGRSRYDPESHHSADPAHRLQPADHRHRRRRRRHQCGRQHDRARTCRAWSSSSPTPTRSNLCTAARIGASSLGPHITQGLGAGAKPEIGKAAAEEAADELCATPRRRAHGVHHRRHGRRHRHRRGAGDRPHGARAEHPDRRRGDQAVRLRGRAPRALRRSGHRGAAAPRRYADRHPEPEPVPNGE